MISQIERDQVNPSIRVLEKLRVALHVPLSALLEDNELSPSCKSLSGARTSGPAFGSATKVW